MRSELNIAEGELIDVDPERIQDEYKNIIASWVSKKKKILSGAKTYYFPLTRYLFEQGKISEADILDYLPQKFNQRDFEYFIYSMNDDKKRSLLETVLWQKPSSLNSISDSSWNDVARMMFSFHKPDFIKACNWLSKNGVVFTNNLIMKMNKDESKNYEEYSRYLVYNFPEEEIFGSGWKMIELFAAEKLTFLNWLVGHQAVAGKYLDNLVDSFIDELNETEKTEFIARKQYRNLKGKGLTRFLHSMDRVSKENVITSVLKDTALTDSDYMELVKIDNLRNVSDEYALAVIKFVVTRPKIRSVISKDEDNFDLFYHFLKSADMPKTREFLLSSFATEIALNTNKFRYYGEINQAKILNSSAFASAYPRMGREDQFRALYAMSGCDTTLFATYFKNIVLTKEEAEKAWGTIYNSVNSPAIGRALLLNKSAFQWQPTFNLVRHLNTILSYKEDHTLLAQVLKIHTSKIFEEPENLDSIDLEWALVQVFDSPEFSAAWLGLSDEQKVQTIVVMRRKRLHKQFTRFYPLATFNKELADQLDGNLGLNDLDSKQSFTMFLNPTFITHARIDTVADLIMRALQDEAFDATYFVKIGLLNWEMLGSLSWRMSDLYDKFPAIIPHAVAEYQKLPKEEKTQFFRNYLDEIYNHKSAARAFWKSQLDFAFKNKMEDRLASLFSRMTEDQKLDFMLASGIKNGVYRSESSSSNFLVSEFLKNLESKTVQERLLKEYALGHINKDKHFTKVLFWLYAKGEVAIDPSLAKEVLCNGIFDEKIKEAGFFKSFKYKGLKKKACGH